MDKNYLKNKDPRPKRRRDKSNPYEIFTVGIETDSPHYYMSFTDSRGIHICMEINKSLFELFDRFELDDLSYLNKLDRHRAYQELSDETLYQYSSSAGAQVEDHFRFDHLHKAIEKLTSVQKRRLILYYFYEYTLAEIAALEGCSLPSVSRTIIKAKNKLKDILSDYYEI